MKNALRIASILAASYVLLETVLYLSFCCGLLRPDLTMLHGSEFEATDRPCTRFDPITGYRYLPGGAKLVWFNGERVSIDHHIHVNKQGYCSVEDYPRVTPSGAKRYVVFGDSYTAGEVSDTAWPDLANRFLRAARGEQHIILLNFGLEAAGLPTWHRQFFQEVVPSLEFDGIILTVFGGGGQSSYDLNRNFIVKHSFDEVTRLGFFEVLPDKYTWHQAQKNLIRSTSVFNAAALDYYRHASERRLSARWLGWLPLKPYAAILVGDHHL